MSFLPISIKDELHKESSIAEKAGKLTDRQLNIIYAQKLFNLFVPENLGGLELGLIDGLLMEEEIAKIDGSLGWTITLCSGANAFVGYLPCSISLQFFSNPKVCLGGSGKIGGIARETADGYIVNGKWSYVTGTPHNTIFTANCKIEREGKIVTNNKGIPVYQSFFFLPEEVTVIEDWHTMGLIATASHSYKVENLKVGKERAFVIEAGMSTLDHPIYKYPFLTFSELTLAVNHLGMQEHFLEEAQTLFNSIQETLHKEFRTRLLKNATEDILQRRELFFTYAKASWEELIHKGKIPDEMTEKISVLCKEIVKKGRETALQVYPYLGISASDPGTELNRIIRDILTASQHSLLL